MRVPSYPPHPPLLTGTTPVEVTLHVLPSPLEPMLSPRQVFPRVSWSMYINDGCWTFGTMTWWGLQIIRTRYVAMVHSPAPRSSHRRFSVLLNLPGSTCRKCLRELGRTCDARTILLSHTGFCHNSLVSVASQPLGKALATYTKGRSTAQRFPSNVQGYTPRTVLTKQQRYAIDAVGVMVWKRLEYQNIALSAGPPPNLSSSLQNGCLMKT